MAKTKGNANFSGALGAYFFFTRRYLIGFYLAMGFAAGFAVFISLLTLLLMAVGVLPGEDFARHGRFFTQMVVFFGVGLLVLLAAVTIAFHLWQVIIRRSDVRGEFPEMVAQMRVLRAFSDAKPGAGSAFLAFLVPSVVVASVMVLPLFGLIAAFAGFLGVDSVRPIAPIDLFVPAYFLVWVSVFLMNLHYYLGSRRVHEVK
jgi:hypothetical protein